MITAGSNFTSVCPTSTCQRVASYMLGSLAPNWSSIDPCTNFDTFACEGFNLKTSIPPDQDRVTAGTLARDALLPDLKDLLEGQYPSSDWISTSFTPDQTGADRSNFEQLQKAYRACVDNTPEIGLQHLKQVMAFIAAAYPAHWDSNRSSDEIARERAAAMGTTLLFFAQAGIPSILTISPSTDISTNSSKIEIKAGSQLDKSWETPSDGASDQDYIHVGADILSAVYPDQLSHGTALRLMGAVAELEDQMTKAASDYNQPEVARTYKRADLDTFAPHLNLSYIVDNLKPVTYKYETVFVVRPFFFGNASRELFESFPNEVIQGFFMWTAIKMLAPWVGSSVTSKYVDYQGRKKGLSSISKAQGLKYCMDILRDGPESAEKISGEPGIMSWILARFFIGKTYSKETRYETDGMLTSLQKAFISRMHQKDWISEDSKVHAEAHINSVEHHLGFPDFFLDPPILHAFSTSMNISSHSHIWNALAFAKSDASLRWLATPFDTQGFAQSPMINDARYVPFDNFIVVLAAESQFPNYVSPPDQVPSYVNYGMFGAILGHEITHMYDGSSAGMVGWDQPSRDALNERAKCLVGQYDGFTVQSANGTSLHVKGADTLGENMADHGGVRTAFAAWKDSIVAKGADQGLPGLEGFTPEQLFFLRWAQGWCQVARPEFVDYTVLHDTHAPKFARILAPMANSRDFREAYACPVKAPTCEVW